jgi:hypothetical protein
MPATRLAVAALLLLAAAPAVAAAPTQAASQVGGHGLVLVLHDSVGTGACAAARSDTSRVDNPCWLQLGLAPAIRTGHLEIGPVYEGRELLTLVTLLLVRPPAATVVGLGVGAVFEPGERWRLLASGEVGWRRYWDFAGRGLSDRKGVADVAYLGLTGRTGFGLRPQSGRTDRLEVSVSVRSDLKTARSTVAGVPWQVGGWSITMGLGLVTEW